MFLAVLAAVGEVAPAPSEVAPPAPRGVVEVAVLALIVSVISLGWQVVSWWKTQRPRAKIEVSFGTASTDSRYVITYDEQAGTVPQPAKGSGRGALVARILNLGVHAFEVTAVTYEPPAGEPGGRIGALGGAPPDPADGIACTIPGVVNGHSHGMFWIFMDDLVEVFPPGSKIVVKMDLGSGTEVRSRPVSMDELLEADANRPAAEEG